MLTNISKKKESSSLQKGIITLRFLSFMTSLIKYSQLFSTECITDTDSTTLTMTSNLFQVMLLLVTPYQIFTRSIITVSSTLCFMILMTMSMSHKKVILRDICWVLSLLIIEIRVRLRSIRLMTGILMEAGWGWSCQILHVIIFFNILGHTMFTASISKTIQF
jgi:hypothetical protein